VGGKLASRTSSCPLLTYKTFFQLQYTAANAGMNGKKGKDTLETLIPIITPIDELSPFTLNRRRFCLNVP
jgi:hypothetical protein